MTVAVQLHTARAAATSIAKVSGAVVVCVSGVLVVWVCECLRSWVPKFFFPLLCHCCPGSVALVEEVGVLHVHVLCAALLR